MANWLITWINDGNFMEKEIIPSGFRSQAMTIQMATGGGLPDAENPDLHAGGYGLAWGISSYRGHYRVEHGGGIDGFITSTCLFPSDSIGIFVVTNQGGPTGAIRNFIADRLLNLEYRNWSKMQLNEKMKSDSLTLLIPNNDSIDHVRGTMPSHGLEDYCGSYENKGYGVAKILLENDTTWIDYNEAGKKPKSYLQHYHYDVFRVRSIEEEEDHKNAPKVRFVTDEKGEISTFMIKMEPTVDDIEFEKLSPTFKIKEDALNKYVGDYDLNAATVKVYVRGDGVLMVLVPGQPDYELVPTEIHEFKLKIAEDYKVKFDVSSDNTVLSLSFIQPNGTFKAKRKD
ncbi:MAG: DUF3471 domain-containing protein [Saprospiraceae bacterium]|nr:DUF3471 domain-containing protein [Saprospiraceae bacterium]